MGSLYKHDVCKPDYVDHGMDKIEDPRLKSMILSSLTNTDSRWIIAYTRYTRFLHTIYGWLLMNATHPKPPRQRPTRVFEVPDDMKIRILEGLQSWSHTPIRWRSTDWIRRCSACDSDTKYVFCWTPREPDSHGYHLDRCHCHHRRSISVWRHSDEVSSQDRMPRSNGVVKSLASYKTFSTIKDSEADIEELPIIQTSSGSFSKMPRHQCNDIV
jgi:hypothetical protein